MTVGQLMAQAAELDLALPASLLFDAFDILAGWSYAEFTADMLLEALVIAYGNYEYRAATGSYQFQADADPR